MKILPHILLNTIIFTIIETDAIKSIGGISSGTTIRKIERTGTELNSTNRLRISSYPNIIAMTPIKYPSSGMAWSKLSSDVYWEFSNVPNDNKFIVYYF